MWRGCGSRMEAVLCSSSPYLNAWGLDAVVNTSRASVARISVGTRKKVCQVDFLVFLGS